jgi:hypothetical protein
MTRRAILAVVALAALTAPAVQADETAQKFGFSPEQFEIKFYIQPRYAYFVEPERSVDNTFSVRRGRIYLTSKVSPHITGRIQFEVKPEKVEALDVYFTWLHDGGPLGATLGQFKKPLSYQEFVMSSSNLNLIDRPFINGFLEKNLLISARDQGLMGLLDLKEGSRPAALHMGVFNGNGLNRKEDDNSGKQFAGRASIALVPELRLALNGAVNRLSRADTSGTYAVWGGDVVWGGKEGLQAVAEFFTGENYEEAIGGDLPLSAEVPDFLGWYAEAIYRFPGGWEPAARIESFDPDTDTDDDERLILVGQVARSFSPNFRWQVNVVNASFSEEGRDSETELISQWTIRL